MGGFSGSLASEKLRVIYRGPGDHRQLLNDLDQGFDNFKPQILSLRAKNGNIKANSGMALVDESQLGALLRNNKASSTRRRRFLQRTVFAAISAISATATTTATIQISTASTQCWIKELSRRFANRARRTEKLKQESQGKT